jgi:hypothetical protein
MRAKTRTQRTALQPTEELIFVALHRYERKKMGHMDIAYRQCLKPYIYLGLMSSLYDLRTQRCFG